MTVKFKMEIHLESAVKLDAIHRCVDMYVCAYVYINSFPPLPATTVDRFLCMEMIINTYI